MSAHSHNNTPRIFGYLAGLLVLLVGGILAYNAFVLPPQQSIVDAGGSEPVSNNVVCAQNPDGTGPVLDMELENGHVCIELDETLAPQHVEQIVALVEREFYDGIVFHRVIDGFMAQTGDPTGTGMGGSDLPDIPAEFTTEQSFERGTVGMARSASPNSANSQFFIMFEPAPHLDGQYTIIGQVTAGMEMIDALPKGDPADGGVVPSPDRMVTLSIATGDASH